MCGVFVTFVIVSKFLFHDNRVIDFHFNCRLLQISEQKELLWSSFSSHLMLSDFTITINNICKTIDKYHRTKLNSPYAITGPIHIKSTLTSFQQPTPAVDRQGSQSGDRVSILNVPPQKQCPGSHSLAPGQPYVRLISPFFFIPNCF